MATTTKRATKRTAAKRTTARKSAAKRSTAARKTSAKKTSAKKTSPRKRVAKKSTAKKTGARTTGAKKTGARKASAGKTTARKTTARTAPARKSSAKKAPARKKSAAKSAGQYTKPELRERIKARILRDTKGGKAGQWSARKAQLLAHEYEAEGGGYKGGKSGTQRHLQQWTHEEWTTSDGKRAQRESATTRYLPKKAWSRLSASEKAATNRKKVEGSRRGRQHVANTTRATRARRAATTHR